MDKYFYMIELDGNQKVIHFLGNIYFNDVDTTEYDHRIAEYTGVYLTYEDLQSLIEDDCLFEYINERVNYLDNVTKQEAEESSLTYFDGEPGTEVYIKNVTEDTPCGCYWYQTE